MVVFEWVDMKGCSGSVARCSTGWCVSPTPTESWVQTKITLAWLSAEAYRRAHVVEEHEERASHRDDAAVAGPCPPWPTPSHARGCRSRTCWLPGLARDWAVAPTAFVPVRPVRSAAPDHQSEGPGRLR